MRKSASIVVLAAALCLASAAVAQTVIETKVKSGTVIGKTDHSVVIKMDDGVVREFEVPPGRTATVDGKEVGLADLKIGTTLSATFKTVARPVEVKTVTIKDGEVVKVAGATLTTKEKDGFHNYVVPKGFRFNVDGGETGIDGLHQGMKLNATIVTTSAGDDDRDEARRRRDRQGAGRARPRCGRTAPPPAATRSAYRRPGAGRCQAREPAAPATTASAPETAATAAPSPAPTAPAPTPEPTAAGRARRRSSSASSCCFS